MMTNNLPIAVFDSGVGGLTVLKAIRDILPHEDLLYLGDTARVPYGIKSGETIARYTLHAATSLASRGIKMLVVACNTATAAALPILRDKFAPMPVIGVIEPGARAAVEASQSGKIAVIGTEATIKGGAYQKAIGRIAPSAEVRGRACTLFVSLAEEGWITGPIAEGIARRYLEDIFGPNVPERPDTLLLGCTHFPLLIQPLRAIAGVDTAIVDSARATAKTVAKELEQLDICAPGGKEGGQHFLTTDNPERFAHAGSLFLNSPLAPEDVELVDL